jgi:hypothetical protein
MVIQRPARNYSNHRPLITNSCQEIIVPVIFTTDDVTKAQRSLPRHQQVCTQGLMMRERSPKGNALTANFHKIIVAEVP